MTSVTTNPVKIRAEYNKTLNKIVGNPKPVPANSILTPKGMTKDNPIYKGTDMAFQGVKAAEEILPANVLKELN